MPQNCSADIQAVIAHVDETLESGSEAEIQSLKDTFGLGNVTHNLDFAWARAYLNWLRSCARSCLPADYS